MPRQGAGHAEELAGATAGNTEGRLEEEGRPRRRALRQAGTVRRCTAAPRVRHARCAWCCLPVPANRAFSQRGMVKMPMMLVPTAKGQWQR